MASLLGGLLLREVPEALIAGVRSGQYQVYGSIVRSVSSGRVVGHLQEAGGLRTLVSLIGNSQIGMALQGAQIVQNEQIKSGLRSVETGIGQLHAAMTTLQHLGVANLALGGAGIGVSMAGFAIMSRKIDGVRLAVEATTERIDAIGYKIEKQPRLAALEKLRGLAASIDESWALSDAAAERRWLDDGRLGVELIKTFEDQADQMLARGPAGLSMAAPMLDAISMTSALRFTALAAAGETKAALDVAKRDAQLIEKLTGGIGLIDLARGRLIERGLSTRSPDIREVFEDVIEEVRSDEELIRSREAAANTRAAPLEMLEATGIRPRDWLAAAYEEKEAPLLAVMEKVG